MKSFLTNSADWYRRDGAPVSAIWPAEGSLRFAKMQPVTLRDAREQGLLPSVDNVLSVIAQPELESWKQERAVIEGLGMPRLPGEHGEAFAKRVVAVAETVWNGAADFSADFHIGAACVAHGVRVGPPHPAAEWLRHYRDWLKANCVRLLGTERVLVNEEVGYAGTADLLMEHRVHGLTLVDLKTQHVRGNSGPGTYRSWGYELAAYRAAFAKASASAPLRRDGPARQAGATGGKPVTCMNLILNSREPHPPVEAPLSEEHLGRGWSAFEAAHRLWVMEKSYDPGARRTGHQTALAAKGNPVWN